MEIEAPHVPTAVRVHPSLVTCCRGVWGCRGLCCLWGQGLKLRFLDQKLMQGSRAVLARWAHLQQHNGVLLPWPSYVYFKLYRNFVR